MIVAPTTNQHGILNAQLKHIKEGETLCTLDILFNTAENQKAFLEKTGPIPPGDIAMRMGLGRKLSLCINIKNPQNVLEEIKPTLGMLTALAGDFDFTAAISSSPVPIMNSFDIKAVNVVNAPDFDAPRPDCLTIITATKPGLEIGFETEEKRDTFLKDLVPKIGSDCPFTDVRQSMARPIVALDVKSNDDAQTTLEKLAPALAFLTQHYPGFDFNGTVSAQLAAEPSSSNPAITAQLDASRKRGLNDITPSSAPAPNEGSIKRQDTKKEDCRIM